MNDTYTLHESARYLVDECRRVGIAEAFGTAPRRDDMRRTSCKCNGGCESVLECDFWYWIRKTPMMEREAARQVQIGPYRVDCLFECGGKMVVVELDGAAYHDPEADWYRDGDLLMVIDAVIRIPYAPVKFFPHECSSQLVSTVRTWQLRHLLRVG